MEQVRVPSATSSEARDYRYLHCTGLLVDGDLEPRSPMCGLAGIVRGTSRRGVSLDTLARMAGATAASRSRRLRGLCWFAVGLAHVRLSIIDVAGGAQPMSASGRRASCDRLQRRDLQLPGAAQRARGARPSVPHAVDTEVLVHGYGEWGSGLLRGSTDSSPSRSTTRPPNAVIHRARPFRRPPAVLRAARTATSISRPR